MTRQSNGARRDCAGETRHERRPAAEESRERAERFAQYAFASGLWAKRAP